MPKHQHPWCPFFFSKPESAFFGNVQHSPQNRFFPPILWKPPTFPKSRYFPPIQSENRPEGPQISSTNPNFPPALPSRSSTPYISTPCAMANPQHPPRVLCMTVLGRKRGAGREQWNALQTKRTGVPTKQRDGCAIARCQKRRRTRRQAARVSLLGVSLDSALKLMQKRGVGANPSFS